MNGNQNHKFQYKEYFYMYTILFKTHFIFCDFLMKSFIYIILCLLNLHQSLFEKDVLPK